MVRNMMLILFTVLAIGMMMPAYAETQLSPLKQFNMGIPIEQIQCNENKVLMLSNSGRPSCITVDTSVILADRGFSFVNYPDEKTHFENPTTTITFLAPEDDHVLTSEYRANVSLEFPNSISVGEEFAISFVVDPRTDNASEILDTGLYHYAGFVPTDFEILTEFDSLAVTRVDKYEHHGMYEYEDFFTDSMVDKEKDTFVGSINLKLDDEMVHEFDYFVFNAGLASGKLMFEKTDGGAILSKADPEKIVEISSDRYRNNPVPDPSTFDFDAYEPDNAVTVSEQTLSCVTYPDRARELNPHICDVEGWVIDPYGNVFWASQGCSGPFPYGPDPSSSKYFGNAVPFEMTSQYLVYMGATHSKYFGNAIPSEIVCPNAKKENISSERSCFETSGCTSQWFPDLEAVPTFIDCPADAGVVDNGNIVFPNFTCHDGGLWRLP